jgi:hypothetical protein
LDDDENRDPTPSDWRVEIYKKKEKRVKRKLDLNVIVVIVKTSGLV